jgi:hypothetical protein
MSTPSYDFFYEFYLCIFMNTFEYYSAFYSKKKEVQNISSFSLCKTYVLLFKAQNILHIYYSSNFSLKWIQRLENRDIGIKYNRKW